MWILQPRVGCVVSVTGCLCLFACNRGLTEQKPAGQTAAEQKSAEPNRTGQLPWQTDWRKYVEEVAKQMVDYDPTGPGFEKVFKGKEVTWEGEVAQANKTRKPGMHFTMNMPSVDIEVPESRFPGRFGQDKVKLTVNRLLLRMTPELEKIWANVPVGTRVRFRARLDILEVLVLEVGTNKGNVWFLVHDAQPLNK